VPTGIVTNEMVNAVRNKQLHTEACPVCGRESHDADAKYCKYCGAKL
jgi:voltage-gated potassium channel